MILTAMCDHLQVSGAYVLSLENSQLELVTSIGNEEGSESVEQDLLIKVAEQSDIVDPITIGGKICFPLRDGKVDGNNELLGFMVIQGTPGKSVLKDHEEQIKLLASRAGLALRDKILQEQIFQSLEKSHRKWKCSKFFGLPGGIAEMEFWKVMK